MCWPALIWPIVRETTNSSLFFHQVLTIMWPWMKQEDKRGPRWQWKAGKVTKAKQGKSKSNDVCTVLAIGNKIKPLLCSKLALFKTPWQMFRVLTLLSRLGSYLPLLRAFQWGTAWPFSLRDIKITTSQSWKFYFHVLSRFRFFNFYLSYFWYPL